MLDITVRPGTEADLEQLEKWRSEFQDGLLEVPNGYEGNGLETAVAEARDGRILGSLTATSIVSLDPYIRNPHAGKAELLQSLFALCRALEYRAKRAGLVESYIAVPNLLEDYQSVVKRCGFQETAENCKIYRHRL